MFTPESRSTPVSPKIAAFVAHWDRQRLDGLGDQVHHIVLSLQPAADDDAGGVAGDPAVALPDGSEDDDVEHAGLVFQVEEGDPSCGAWALSMCDEAGHFDPAVRLVRFGVSDAEDALLGQL